MGTFNRLWRATLVTAYILAMSFIWLAIFSCIQLATGSPQLSWESFFGWHIGGAISVLGPIYLPKVWYGRFMTLYRLKRFRRGLKRKLRHLEKEANKQAIPERDLPHLEKIVKAHRKAIKKISDLIDIISESKGAKL